MADMDTPQKRFSAMHLAMPWRGPAIVPTGTVNAAERVTFLNYYSGIALAAPGGGSPIAVKSIYFHLAGGMR